ncbi:MAG: peptidoglycan DD-metalloendopeptidase family protein [bacterium]
MPTPKQPYKARLFSYLLCASVLLCSLQVKSLEARSHKVRKKHPRSSSTKIHSARVSNEAELKKLRREIAKTEQELKQHTLRERKSAKSLAEFDKKTRLLKNRLSNLQTKASQLEEQVNQLDQSIEKTSSSIDTLKKGYEVATIQKYMQGSYKSHATDNMMFGDPNEAAQRARDMYFGHLVGSAFNRNKIELDSTKTNLSNNKDEVSEVLNLELSRIDATKEQELTAEAQKKAQAQELRQIQNSKQQLQRELEKRKASAKRLEGIIANLLAKEEAQRKQREKEISRRMAERKRKKKGGKKLSRQDQDQESRDIAESKSLAGPHSLSWPTSSHKIVQGFGEHRNRELGTVTMNLGIDIGTSSGSAVHSAGDGVVSLISSLPSYGTIMIIRHGGGVHSVYADLGSTKIGTGSKVTKGQLIASSGTNSELGAVLHFEVWKGKSKQNPLGWLK